ncbi:MAG: PAS domain-containing protein [Nitrospiraceae bacterium]|nr:PAS domain-containing protein [Nitrospiraceae bacterium]
MTADRKGTVPGLASLGISPFGAAKGSPAGICLLDPRGQILFRSPSFEEILGALSLSQTESPPLALTDALLSLARSPSPEKERRLQYMASDPGGQVHVVDCQIFSLSAGNGFTGGSLIHVQDMTDLEALSRETLTFGRYQDVLGKIAHLAVTGARMAEVAELAARETARALNVEFCKILIPGDSDPLLHLLAGVGWKEGLVGTYVQEGGFHSQAGFAIRERMPVVVEDLLSEKRFSPSTLLSGHNVRSGVSVPMMFHDQVLGAMSIHTLSVRRFDEREIGFLETVANTVATILERWKREEIQLSLYNRLFAQLQDGVILTDVRGVILEWNPAMERISGWSRQEAIGKTPSILSSGRQGSEFIQGLWRTILSGKSFTGRFIDRRKDRTEFLVWENISPVMDPDHTIRYFLAILTDLSEREKLLEALRHTEQIKLFGQLAGGLLHEIRNPLIGMGSLADHIADVRSLPDEIRRQAGLIAGEARRIDDLLESHLSVLRPKTFDFQPLDLEELVRDAESLLRQTLLKGGVRFVFQPAEEGVPLVEGARGPLQQVFLNLMMNGLEAMPGGGVLSVRLSGTTFRDRKGVSIVVRDSGKGIPESLLKRLNEPFFTHGKAKGVGLGLAITRDIVDRHGGQLIIESPVGEGVRATVWLPEKQEES